MIRVLAVEGAYKGNESNGLIYQAIRIYPKVYTQWGMTSCQVVFLGPGQETIMAQQRNLQPREIICGMCED